MPRPDKKRYYIIPIIIRDSKINPANIIKRGYKLPRQEI